MADAVRTDTLDKAAFAEYGRPVGHVASGAYGHDLRLPFPSCYESSITEAEDLEIGHIWFQIEKGDLHVTAQQKKRISKLRRLRNVLSHQQVAKPADIEFLIGCGRDFPDGGADKIPDPE